MADSRLKINLLHIFMGLISFKKSVYFDIKFRHSCPVHSREILLANSSIERVGFKRKCTRSFKTEPEGL